MVNAAEGEEREAALETLASVIAAGTLDCREGVAAFRERREPAFAGR
jgi:enoyl-CoA hydratase/carnithine racemase